jgi:hypothetical protein
MTATRSTSFLALIDKAVPTGTVVSLRLIGIAHHATSEEVRVGEVPGSS